MNREVAYHKLVMRFHEYHYDSEFYVFVADTIERMRKKGCPPELCTSILHMSLLNAAIPACERKD